MSIMTTNTEKPKTRRWQALALAALVLAGGSIAVPQAADAATNSHQKCVNESYAVCKQRITVKKTGAYARTLYVHKGSYFNFRHEFRVVDLSRGKVICSGTLMNGEWKRCSVPNRSAVLSIEVHKAWYQPLDIYATLY